MRTQISCHTPQYALNTTLHAPGQRHGLPIRRVARSWGQPYCSSSRRATDPWTGSQSLIQALDSSKRYKPQGRLCSVSATGVSGSAYQTQATQEIISRFYGALNRRDLTAVASCFALDAMYENMGVEGVVTGREAVTRFCFDSMSAVPDDAVFVLEQQTEGAGTSSAVVWRLVMSSSQTIMSRGIAFYALDQQGLISGVTECHEHPVKVSQSSLSLVRPLVKTLSGPMLPAVQEVNRTIQQGMGTLLDPFNALANLVQQQPLPPQAQAPSISSAQQPLKAGTVSAGAGASTAWASQSAAQAPQQQHPSSVPARSGYSRQGSGYSSLSGVGSRSSAVTAGASSSFAPSTSGQPAAAAAAAAAADSRPASPYARVQAAAVRRSVAAGTAAAAAAGGGGPAGHQQEVVDLSGLWAKDTTRSDTRGYEAMLDVLGLSGLQKVTARLIEGIEVKQTRDQFTVGFVTLVPFFKVTETVPLNAGSTQQSRRDLRSGRQTATAKTVDGGVLVEMSWGQPMAGTLTEQYTLLPDGSLCVHAEAHVGQQQAAADSIYTRSKGSRDALLSESRRRNGSFNDVLQRQQQQGLGL